MWIVVAGVLISVAGAAATWVGIILNRRSEKEANANVEELNDVQALDLIIKNLRTDAGDLRTELEGARGQVRLLNAELAVAQENVGILVDELNKIGRPIPRLREMRRVS